MGWNSPIWSRKQLGEVGAVGDGERVTLASLVALQADIGAILMLLGSTGRQVGGRRHYW